MSVSTWRECCKTDGLTILSHQLCHNKSWNSVAGTLSVFYSLWHCISCPAFPRKINGWGKTGECLIGFLYRPAAPHLLASVADWAVAIERRADLARCFVQVQVSCGPSRKRQLRSLITRRNSRNDKSQVMAVGCAQEIRRWCIYWTNCPGVCTSNVMPVSNPPQPPCSPSPTFHICRPLGLQVFQSMVLHRLCGDFPLRCAGWQREWRIPIPRWQQTLTSPLPRHSSASYT